jgi:hypothetical protein
MAANETGSTPSAGCCYARPGVSKKERAGREPSSQPSDTPPYRPNARGENPAPVAGRRMGTVVQAPKVVNGAAYLLTELSVASRSGASSPS